jgi:hypothetical protein
MKRWIMPLYSVCGYSHNMDTRFEAKSYLLMKSFQPLC